MIHRRHFLAGLLAAPAIVHSENLMKLWVPKPDLVVTGFFHGFSVWELQRIYQKYSSLYPERKLVINSLDGFQITI